MTATKLPPGFVRRRKKACPYPPNTSVELLLLTEDGPVSTGPTVPRVHPEAWELGPDEIGGVVGMKRMVDPRQKDGPLPEPPMRVPVPELPEHLRGQIAAD